MHEEDERLAAFLDAVCEPLFWPPYRRRVRRELTDHILSRAALLERSAGCSHAEAVGAAAPLAVSAARTAADAADLPCLDRNRRLPALSAVPRVKHKDDERIRPIGFPEAYLEQAVYPLPLAMQKKPPYVPFPVHTEVSFLQKTSVSYSSGANRRSTLAAMDCSHGTRRSHASLIARLTLMVSRMSCLTVATTELL